MTQVIISAINFNTPYGESLSYIKFLATDGHGTILKSVTCNKADAKETIANYCTQYNFQIV